MERGAISSIVIQQLLIDVMSNLSSMAFIFMEIVLL